MSMAASWVRPVYGTREHTSKMMGTRDKNRKNAEEAAKEVR